jgi:hypothetical protein
MKAMRNSPKMYRSDVEGAQARDKTRLKNKAVIHWVALIFILALSLWVRMDDLWAWHRQPHRAFYNNQPLLINFDGYFYLSLARDLTNHTYRPSDSLRGVPDPQPRPWPPPLLSALAAAIAAICPLSLDWTGVLLPPLLGLTLALPLYLMGRLYGGSMMALVATCIGLCAQYYVYRSSLGWFDTDCLNVTFAFLITYIFIRFGLEPRRRRFVFLSAGLLFSGLFFLWWDQARSSVVLICLTCLGLVLTLFYRPKGRERWIALTIAICVLGLLFLWQGPQIIMAPFKQVGGMLDYISKAQPDVFPNTGLSIFEQKRLSFEGLVEKTTGHLVPFIIGIAGLGWLFYSQKRKAAALILLFVLGCLSFIFARRFLIFLNPFIALGLGFVAQQAWDLRKQRPFLTQGAPVLAVLLCFFPVKNSLGKVYWPKEIPPLIEGMDRLSQETANDAVIWAWWDHGYPMRYWSQRATINDGSLHSGRLTVCNAIPLAAPSQKLAANFINFFCHRGLQGLEKLFNTVGSPDSGMHMLEKILEAGPKRADPLLAAAGLLPTDHWRKFFFPPQQRELYLYLDLRLARTTYWWYWFGTWNVALQDGQHAQFKLIRDSHEKGGHIEGPDMIADLANGRLTYRQKTYPLSRSYFIDGVDRTRTGYGTTDGLVFAFQKQAQVGAFMDQSFANSVFNHLFILADADPAYFSLIAQNYPYYQIWKVTADMDEN